jgi:threonine dehydratase
MHVDYLQRILTSRVYEVARETPLDEAPRLSSRLGNRVLLKREDLQSIFSFKLRGAYNRMVRLSAEELRRGVVAASAGNHAQGVALSAQRLGCPAHIVMPVTTPPIKVASVRGFGAQVELVGDAYDEAAAHALARADREGLCFIHPYDDPDVIAGQGTIGMELLRQCTPPPDQVFVPVGGGGLIAGIAVFLKRVQPSIRVVGVEPDDAAALHAALRAGRRVRLDTVGLFVDGVAVRQVGEEPYRICREAVDEVILVDTDAICAAIKDGFEDTRSVLEPAGALSVAGLKAAVARDKIRGQTLVAIASGANMNFNRLRHVSERAELGEETEAILAVTIPEQPGSFRAFCGVLGQRSITEFNYRYADPARAHVFVGLQVRDRAETDAIVAELNAAGYTARNFSDNELAMVHIRHMVGGRAAGVRDERLLRFEFPERPGALGRFLNAMRHTWNISLFHYRNYGADFGRVLIGMQVPEEDMEAFDAFLDRMGYAYAHESDNPAYGLFLSP